MARDIVLGIALLFALAVGVGAGQQAQEFERRYAEAQLVLAGELVELAEWCKENKLFASSEATYREVLALEPENAAARKALGHKKQRDGSWKEPKARAKKDHDKDAAKELVDARRRVDRDHAGRCLKLLNEHGGDLPAQRRDQIVAELLKAAPDDPAVRRLTGETRGEGGWVLEETVRAKQRRKELREIVQRGFKASKAPRKVSPDEREAAFPIAWKLSVDADVARVHGTGRPEEVQVFGRVMQVAREYFRRAFDAAEVDYYPRATIFLLAQEGEKEVFLESHPKVDETYREFLMGLEGSGITMTSDLAYWAADEKARIDGSTRIVLGWLFRQAFGITTDHAWVHEGFGLYLTRELVGTRLTWFAMPSEYLPPEQDVEMRARLMDPKTNWMDEANKMLNGERAPKLVFVMGKDVNNLTPEDLLFSYVTAAYLLEGCPDETPELLRRIGSGTVSAAAVEEVLGYNVHELEKRVRRWVTERK